MSNPWDKNIIGNALYVEIRKSIQDHKIISHQIYVRLPQILFILLT